MKMSPLFEKAQHNMMPGKITKDGFLGDDHRTVVDIIQHDEESMEAFGIDWGKLVERMKYLMSEGLKGLGEPITVNSKWLVKVDEARGKIPCPFEDVLLRKQNLQVTNLINNESLMFSEISIHLLEAHHFLEGKGSFFRLEPEQLKKVFDL